MCKSWTIGFGGHPRPLPYFWPPLGTPRLPCAKASGEALKENTWKCFLSYVDFQVSNDLNCIHTRLTCKASTILFAVFDSLCMTLFCSLHCLLYFRLCFGMFATLLALFDLQNLPFFLLSFVLVVSRLVHLTVCDCFLHADLDSMLCLCWSKAPCLEMWHKSSTALIRVQMATNHTRGKKASTLECADF